MALKHRKYVYVERSDGWYVKVRVLKGRAESDPSRYIVVGPKVREPPLTAEVIREASLPEEVRKKLYEV
ncbi:MAG: cren protein [Crenarchaeota archaeon]|nr:cren protein [Thermoproteota archaeon]